MKLVRFGEWRTGLVVELSTGPRLIDVVASVGVLLPDDPVSNGVLNGILRDGGGWAPLIEHWPHARAGLRKMAQLASRSPDHPGLVLRPLDDIIAAPPSGNTGRIVALEITESAHAVESTLTPPAIRDLFADQRVVALDTYRK